MDRKIKIIKAIPLSEKPPREPRVKTEKPLANKTETPLKKENSDKKGPRK